MKSNATTRPRSLVAACIHQYLKALECIRSVSRKVRLRLFYDRFAVIQSLAEPILRKPPPKVLVGIVHITSEEEAADAEKAKTKVARVTATLDGLLTSFSHCKLEITLITMRNRHVAKFLRPDHRRIVTVKEELDCDPMFIGYRVHELFVNERDKYDWYLFLEDDIEISDSCLLDKVGKFSRLPGMQRSILMPNRFEMLNGVKRYIDLTPFKDIAWNRLSKVMLDGFVLSECSNPHAGMFCLSREQLRMFAEDRRDWRGKDVFGGSRESAATFSLMEHFTLYKPHPDNLHYFECRHVDTKYSELHPDAVDYSYSAVHELPSN